MPVEFATVAYFAGLIELFLECDSVVNAGRAALIWPLILQSCFPHEMAELSDLKSMMLCLIMRGYRNQQQCCHHFDFCEVFAGSGNLTKELLRGGYSGTAFDYCYTSEHNLLEAKPLALLLNCITSLKKNGLAWLGTPCSSFVVLRRAQSKRCESNQWLGVFVNREFVRLGNAMGEISSMIFFIRYALSVWVVLEQPTSSCLPQMPSKSGVLHFSRAQRFSTFMGSFGGKSCKPLQLWSTLPRNKDLEVSHPGRLDSGVELVSRDDAGGFTGNKCALRESEVYTPCFGKHVMQICRTEWGS